MKYNNTIGYDRIRSDQTVHVRIGCGIVKTSQEEKELLSAENYKLSAIVPSLLYYDEYLIQLQTSFAQNCRHGMLWTYVSRIL